MANRNTESSGLTAGQAEALLARYGKNVLIPQKKDSLLLKILHIICEPMFLLLLAAAVIYFILGEARDGAVMLIFVVGIIGIEAAQEWKTDRTLNALKDLSAPMITVLRDGAETRIPSAGLVPGDLMLIHEGVKIPADGVIIRCSDLRVDESSLTGEAEGVWKTQADDVRESSGYWRKDYCYAGTLVTQGTGAILVEKTGTSTEYGKIGLNISGAPEIKTPLQKQTGELVKMSAGIAVILFILVCAGTWMDIPDHTPKDRFIESVLSGITLAMAMIPEEFPVILTVFLSMGAWRLARKNALAPKLASVETLGAVSVLCVDKTGTITMNQMQVQDIWPAGGDEENLIEIMGLACETDAYDPMEKAMLAYCEQKGIAETHLFGGEMLTEYAFTDELKMMGHVWRHDGGIIIAAKGSPERILTVCGISDSVRAAAEQKILEMSGQGLRVIAVAASRQYNENDIPEDITGCSLELYGLVGLADPPRASVKSDIAICKKAGIRVVMITGDNGITAAAIAKKIGIQCDNGIITGDMLESMTDDVLRERVKTACIFSRVIPEHKMRIVKAFKDNGEIVAMTGDGVNDAPALKYADIGIAMGKRGSEVSREAAGLILMDDNFSTIVDTVRDGRRIFDNIRKAMEYVFVIHIPIALASLIAPLLGISPSGLMLLPLHVVLLELVIDPTCSIVLERQPAEENIMERRPRDPRAKIIGRNGFLKSVVQGLVIFAASFGAYIYVIFQNPDNAPAARSMGLAAIILANLFLIQVNSSDSASVLHSFARLYKDKVMWLANGLILLGLAVILYTPLNGFLRLAALSAAQLLTVIALAAASVLWYEAVKWIKRRRSME